MARRYPIAGLAALAVVVAAALVVAADSVAAPVEAGHIHVVSLLVVVKFLDS